MLLYFFNILNRYWKTLGNSCKTIMVAKTRAQMVMATISQNLLKAANKITLN